MNSRKLRDAFEYIDDKYLEAVDETVTKAAVRSEKRTKYSRWIKYCSATAAVFLLCAGAVALAHSPYFRQLSPDDAVTVPDTDENSMTMTSETYSTLDDLLEALSNNDGHSGKNVDSEGRSAGVSAAGIAEGEDFAVYGEYIYRPDYDSGTTGIYLHSDSGEQQVGSIDLAASVLFCQGDKLIIVGSYMSGGTELDYEMSTQARIYSLANPAAPKLTDKYVQLGELNTCYMTAGRLFLITSDGECACGWSRLEDKSQYMPAITHNDQVIEWTDAEISILGEPSNVHYTAVSIIDTEVSGLVGRHAFYGDIDSLWFGEGWLAFNLFTSGDMVRVHPELYTFAVGDSFAYTGKLSTAAVLGIAPKAITPVGLINGQYPEIKSVTKTTDEYRVICELLTVNRAQNSHSIMTVTADMLSGEYEYQLLSLDGTDNAAIDEIIWEQCRAIISYSAIADRSSFEIENRLVFAEFSDSGIQYYQNDLRLDHVAGVDGIYYYGSPFGYLSSFIDLGNGNYLRYNETPDGLDIYDLSDSTAPVCLYRSAGDIPEGCRFEFENYVYDEKTMGIVMITPDENGDYRHADYTWRVYRVDISADQPLILISETPWHESFDPQAAKR